MKVEGDEKEVVRERAGTEEISDKERERRRKRNEKKRKKKMEKEEQAKEVHTIPDDLSDNTSSRTPTKHVNVPTTSPCHVHTVLNAASNITVSPAHVPTVSNCATTSSMPLPPSTSTKPPPASFNNCATSTKPMPMLPKPTITSSASDMACTMA
jgi:hypothetical protein